MTDNPALFKLTKISKPFRLNGKFVFAIPEGKMSKKEIEMLREDDNARVRLHRRPLIANFLPDDIRPKDIPKL